MTEATRLVRDDAYEELGFAYQRLQVATLDAAMQEHGVTDPAVRQKVCESFMFAMGTFHDQKWLKPSAGSEPVYPLLCFSKQFLDTYTPVEELGEVVAPSKMFAFHEFALSSAELLYEGEPIAQVETGNFEEKRVSGYESVSYVTSEMLTRQLTLTEYFAKFVRKGFVSEASASAKQVELESLARPGDEWWEWVGGTEPMMQVGGLAVVRNGRIAWATQTWIS